MRGLMLLVTVLLVLMNSAARSDLLDLGDRTQDTETGLDWLDVTQTGGISYDDILADVGGWDSEGWRHASPAEICVLLISSIPLDVICDPVNVTLAEGPEYDNLVPAFHDLFGTFTQDPGGPNEIDVYRGVFERGAPSPLGSAGGRRLLYLAEDTPTMGFGQPKSVGNPLIGHTLVRPNNCDPLIPGSCQGKPILCDGGPCFCSAVCVPCGPNPCGSACFCEWTGPEFPSPPPLEPIIVTYSMVDPGHFIGIDEFPAGALEPMTVIVDGQSIGTFDEGDSVDFTALPAAGGFAPLASSPGVTEFSVLADMSDPEAFALIAPLDTPGAEFTISVPEPGFTVGLISSLLALVGMKMPRRPNGETRNLAR